MSTPSQKETPGLDPVRDLLGQLESQIAKAEVDRRPAANDQLQDTISAFQSRLASEVREIRSLREDLRAAEQRGNEHIQKFAAAVGELRSQLPGVIDEAVSSRLIEIEERFHQEIKEIHNRSLESFVQSAQARLGQRLASLEGSMSSQMEAMAQLQDYHLRTDRNVQRLLGGLDRLSVELMRLASLAGAPIVPPRRTSPVPLAANDPFQQRGLAQDVPNPVRRPPAPPPSRMQLEEDSVAKEEEFPQTGRRERARSLTALVYVAAGLVVLLPISFIVWSIVAGAGGLGGLQMQRRVATNSPAALSGTALLLKNASEFSAAKNYAAAESIYRNILKTEPANTEAINQLASVLFRQQRYEEAATVMKSLPAAP